MLVFKNSDSTKDHDRVVKMISIPRGLTVLVNGEYEQKEGKLEFDGLDTDKDFGIMESKKAAAKGFKLRNYEQHFSVEKKGKGVLEYEEYFRMDVKNPKDNSVRKFFHRGRSFLKKTTSSTVRLMK